MWNYTEKVKEYFLNPRNVGEIENPDGIGEAGSLACGDALRLTFSLDENGRIKEAKFKTFGCASAIASSSAITEMIIGKNLEEAEKITSKNIVEYLGGLPEEKIHCSVMGCEALEKAIAHYRGEPEKNPAGRTVCHCFNLTERDIEGAVREKDLSFVEDASGYIRACGGCGSCLEEVVTLIEKYRDRQIPEEN